MHTFVVNALYCRRGTVKGVLFWSVQVCRSWLHWLLPALQRCQWLWWRFRWNWLWSVHLHRSVVYTRLLHNSAIFWFLMQSFFLFSACLSDVKLLAILYTIFCHCLLNFLWGAGHYIFPCGFFFYLSFFPRLISAITDWMSAILPHMVWP